jgi:inward rectifier potassium channel
LFAIDSLPGGGSQARSAGGFRGAGATPAFPARWRRKLTPHGGYGAAWPRLEFSRQITVAPHDGVPTLSLRVANRRTGTLHDAAVNLALIRRHHTLEGDVVWRADDLALLRSRVQALSLVFTLRHAIDAASPLHGLSTEQLLAMDAQLVVAITGTDATLAARVHAVRAYEPTDLLWGFRFADVMTVDAGGRTRIELARLHEVVRV